jgi:hypothetical protein
VSEERQVDKLKKLLETHAKLFPNYAYILYPKKDLMIMLLTVNIITSKRPRDLRRGFAAARLLRSRFRIPPKAWMCASCGCCVFSGRGLCVGPKSRPEESYRVWCLWVWSWSFDNEDALPHQGLSHLEEVHSNTRMSTLFNISWSKMGYGLFVYGTDSVTRRKQGNVFRTAKC